MLTLLGDFVPQTPTGALPLDRGGLPLCLLCFATLTLGLY